MLEDEYQVKINKDKILLQENKKKRELELAEFNKQQNQRKENLITVYGEKYGNLIFDRKVEIGMSQKMCSESWV